MAESVPPESRTYRHRKCGTETVVSGQQFEMVSKSHNALCDRHLQ